MKQTILLVVAVVCPNVARAQWSQEFLTSFEVPPYPSAFTAEYDLRSVDIDGDGRNDIVLRHPLTEQLRWLKNTGTEVWPETHLPTPQGLSALFAWEVLDADLDGDFDVVACGFGTGEPSGWLENQSAGTQWLWHDIALPTGAQTAFAHATDWDGDGNRDIVLMTRTSPRTVFEYWLYAASPTGLTFGALIDSVTNVSIPDPPLIADLDGDGDPDFAVRHASGAAAPWIENRSTPGQFEFVPAATSFPFEVIDALDWNGDGAIDLLEHAVVAGVGEVLQVRPSTGPGTYGTPVVLLNSLMVGGSVRIFPLTTTDMDRDGDLDVVLYWSAVNLVPTTLSVIENRSDGGAGYREDVPYGIGFSNSLVDFDSDGDQDLVQITSGVPPFDGGVRVLRNLRTYGQTSSCVGQPNFTGMVAGLEVTASETVAENATMLVGTHMVPGQLALFVTGNTDTTGVMPANSQGTFCLSGSIGRFNRPGEYSFADEDGTARFALDLTDVPTPNGTTAVLAGETRAFQAWYRDFDGNGSPTSNFTQAVLVQFR